MSEWGKSTFKDVNFAIQAFDNIYIWGENKCKAKYLNIIANNNFNSIYLVFSEHT